LNQHIHFVNCNTLSALQITMSENIVYNKIGRGYNKTRKADPYITSRLIALLSAEKNKTYLDIGCGTGNYTVRLAELGLSMVGVDPSELMLNEAKGKSEQVHWVQATAEDIPFADGYFDGAIATLTIHHWINLEKGFRELYRILKPGATIVIFSFTKEQEKGYWFNYFFPEMMKRTFQKAITLETVTDAAAKAGLSTVLTEKYFVAEDLQDMFGYSGKHDPEIYFDPAVRNGISSFSLLADKEEVESGLARLRECIDNGTFEAIKEQYNNDLGDYLFIILKKG
jgi:ubiquinone/menaquinone biosynthesis C-methylase UbiE